jgi:hypothetical protein
MSTQTSGVRTYDRAPRSGRYQTISDRAHSGLINHTVLGRALRRACRSRRVAEVLPETGFFDGGCLSLALALQALIGPAAAVRYVGRPGILDHAVCAVRIGRQVVYLDADGLADARDLKTKIATLELHGIRADDLRIMRGSRSRARAQGIDDWGDGSAPLRDALQPLMRRHCDPARWLEPPVEEPHQKSRDAGRP